MDRSENSGEQWIAIAPARSVLILNTLSRARSQSRGSGACKATDSGRERGVLVIGPFPPPVHGMAFVTEAIARELDRRGNPVVVVSTSTERLARSALRRITRVGVIARGLVRMIRMLPAVHSIYISVSGGWGQVYDAVFSLIGRISRRRVYLHHHSYRYLDKASRLTSLLIRSAGRRAVHVALSPSMARHLRAAYRGIANGRKLSNVAFVPLPPRKYRRVRTELRTIGFLGNISEEKGIFEFLAIVRQAAEEGMSMTACVAGPLADKATEREFRRLVTQLPRCQYLGPVYAGAKMRYLYDVDVLIHPSWYEAEPLVVYEALLSGAPVIASARGAIPDIPADTAIVCVEPSVNFASAALNTLSGWYAGPELLRQASRAALFRSRALRRAERRRLREFLDEVEGSTPSGGVSPG